MLSKVIENTFCCNIDNENILRKVIVKMRLERINMQRVIIEVLLDSRTTKLVISSEFVRK